MILPELGKNLVVLLCASCVEQMPYMDDFSDGLPETPNQTEIFELSDGYGVEKIDTFYIDIDDNGIDDTVKRGRFFTGTAHGYTFYDIYLDNGEKIASLQTHEGADCILHAYKFHLNPFFIKSAKRPVGDDYSQPTAATVEIMAIKDGKMEKAFIKKYSPICDVRYLL